jgi:hypothetical protein
MFLPSLVLTAALALGGAGTAAAKDRVVKVRDACDPTSFNAALGGPVCERDNSGPRVVFDDFIAGLMADGENTKWSFDREKVRLDEGESLRVKFDRGGEGHSFTEVASYGAGCVPELNQVLGLTGPPSADCALIEPTFIGPQRTSFSIDDLSEGTHRFMCLIHPWMQSTVTVR